MKLIHNLQKEALDKNSSVSHILRIALVVAVKLNLTDFKQWIDNELNGYPDAASLPQYRFVVGIMRSYNPHCEKWFDVNVADKKLIKMLEHMPVVDKISVIEELATSEPGIYWQLPSEMAREFARKNCGMQVVAFLGNQQFYGIIDSIRTKILDWALKLEQEGILGEDMTFSQDERTAAQNIVTNHFYGNVTNAPIQQGSSNVINIESHENDIENARALVAEIKRILADMPNSEDKKTVCADIETIESQLKSPKPKMTVIKEILKSTRNILEGMTGSLISASPTIATLFSKLLG